MELMELKEETVSQETVYEGIIVNIRQDKARLTDGRITGREVIERPGGVAVFALDEEERVILVRQFRYPVGEVVLELPAGKLEKGEDPRDSGLRELEEADLEAMGRFLKDPEVMYAYEHGFSAQEVRQWIARQRERYARDGFGLWAAVERETGALVGDCGLTMQDWDGRPVPEIGYHLRRDRWHRGYASEAAAACRDHAFHVLGFREVYSIIRDSNLPSQRVALRTGMCVVGRVTRHYRGGDMPHLVFSVKKP